MGVLHAQVTGAFQVSAAGTGPLGVLREGLIGVVVPFQVAPATPGCLPGFRFRPPPRFPGSGGFFPGWSSPLGAIDELPEFRDSSRSSRASFLPCSASSAFSSAFSARSSAFSACSRVFASCSAAATPGASGTCALHHSRPSVSKSILTAGQPGTPATPAGQVRSPSHDAGPARRPPGQHPGRACRERRTPRRHKDIHADPRRETRPPPVRTEGRPECLREIRP